MEQLIFPVTKKASEKQGGVYSSEANKNALFPSRLRELRKEKGVSQDQLSKELGVSKSTIGLYETGDTLPDAKTLRDLAVYFDVSVDWLLGLATERTTDSDIKKVCKYTGLSAHTAQLLHIYKDMNGLAYRFLRRYFEEIVVYHGSSIELICNSIANAAQADLISTRKSAERAYVEDDNLTNMICKADDGKFLISAENAAHYFLSTAQELAKSSIDSILEEIMQDLSNKYQQGISESDATKLSWNL